MCCHQPSYTCLDLIQAPTITIPRSQLLLLYISIKCLLKLLSSFLLMEECIRTILNNKIFKKIWWIFTLLAHFDCMRQTKLQHIQRAFHVKTSITTSTYNPTSHEQCWYLSFCGPYLGIKWKIPPRLAHMNNFMLMLFPLITSWLINQPITIHSYTNMHYQ